MATLESVAKELSEHILDNYLSLNVFQYVTSRIDNLTYTDSGLPISNKEKLEILDMLEDKLKFGPEYKPSDSVMLNESEDSQAFIELVKMMRNSYKNGK